MHVVGLHIAALVKSVFLERHGTACVSTCNAATKFASKFGQGAKKIEKGIRRISCGSNVIEGYSAGKIILSYGEKVNAHVSPLLGSSGPNSSVLLILGLLDGVKNVEHGLGNETVG